MVESSGLLNRRSVKNATGGSNPPLSASIFCVSADISLWAVQLECRRAAVCRGRILLKRFYRAPLYRQPAFAVSERWFPAKC